MTNQDKKNNLIEVRLFTTLMVLFVAFIITLCIFNINDKNVTEILFGNLMMIALNLIIFIIFKKQNQ